MRSPLLTIGVGCLLWLAGTFSSPAEVRAQVCPRADYTLNTQAEVDAFWSGCSEVSGALELRGADITDLSPLANLAAIGYLSIWDTDNLTSLDGLASLTSVEQFLEIRNNAALTGLDGLSALTSLGSLQITNNPVLTDLDGLSALTSLLIDLIVENNPALANLDRLAGLLTSMEGEVQIVNQDALTDLDFLSTLTVAGRALLIVDNDALINLDGLSALTSVGDLIITGNAALTSLNGLSALTSAEWVEILFNDALTSLDGLSALTFVGAFGEGRHLTIANNDALTDLQGLSALVSVGRLYIHSNAALTSLNGLSALTSVEGALMIQSNAALTSLNGLSALTSVGFNLEIVNNSALTSLDGLSALTSVESLWIEHNAALTDLNGLSALNSVEWRLEILDNDALTSLDGLSGLTSAVGNLRIENNDALTNLDGLSGVTTVGLPPPDETLPQGNVYVIGNAALTSLDGLSGITSMEADLWVEGNAVLTACSYGLYSLISGGGVTGSITMNTNAASGDCNNDGADLVAVIARVQFAHASPDPDLSVVDVYFNDVLMFDDFSFKSASAFMDVTAGQEIQIAVADAASTSSANPIVTSAVTFQDGLTYSVIAAGLTDPSLFPPNPDGLDTSFQWHIRTALEASGASGEFRTRLFHALPDGPTIDHYLETSTTPHLLRDDVGYGAFTPYDGSTPQVFTGLFTPANNPNQTLFTTVGDFSNAADLAVLELLIGFFGPTPSTEWPDLSVVFVYADGTVGDDIPLTRDTTGTLVESSATIPNTFRLNSNYPNPFNPTTTISFDLPRSSVVRLTVLDLLGREVARLVDRQMPVGRHAVTWEAGDLPSGVYLYRLQAGDYVETKRMVVVK